MEWKCPKCTSDSCVLSPEEWITYSWMKARPGAQFPPIPTHGLCIILIQFSSVQSLSRVWLFATPWIAARQASLSINNFQSSLRLTSIESVMPYWLNCVKYSNLLCVQIFRNFIIHVWSTLSNILTPTTMFQKSLPALSLFFDILIIKILKKIICLLNLKVRFLRTKIFYLFFTAIPPRIVSSTK